MKIVAGLIHYNDLPSMKRTIQSIYDHVDYIIAVDGKFSLREGVDDYSTDGSNEYLQTLKKVIIKKFTGYEQDKRNIYMEEATKLKADAILIIDTDEYIEGDWDTFKESLKDKLGIPHNFLNIPLYYTSKDTTPTPRICIRPHEVRYWKTHNITSNNGNLQRIKSKTNLEGISIKNDDTLRNPQWVKDTYEYQLKMIQHEKPLRKQVMG